MKTIAAECEVSEQGAAVDTSLRQSILHTSTTQMNNWEVEARNMLRAEMRRRGVNFKVLQERLEALGVHETSVNLSNKMARGKFSFAFALQCMAAMQEDLQQPALRSTGEKIRARPKAISSSRRRS